jgi:hypothetical protein
MVMVAKVEGEKNMVLIEKVGECIYSMCTLKKELKIKDIRTVAKMARDVNQQTQAQNEDRMEVDGDEWWARMVVREPQRRTEQDMKLQFLIDDEYSLVRITLISDRPQIKTLISVFVTKGFLLVTTLSFLRTLAMYPLLRMPCHRRPPL